MSHSIARYKDHDDLEVYPYVKILRSKDTRSCGAFCVLPDGRAVSLDSRVLCIDRMPR